MTKIVVSELLVEAFIHGCHQYHMVYITLMVPGIDDHLSYMSTGKAATFSLSRSRRNIN